jgi:hypothetical protein
MRKSVFVVQRKHPKRERVTADITGLNVRFNYAYAKDHTPKVDLPKVVLASDYHEFKHIKRTFAKFNARINFLEITKPSTPYAALFFVGEMNEECIKLIEEFNETVHKVNLPA